MFSGSILHTKQWGANNCEPNYYGAISWYALDVTRTNGPLALDEQVSSSLGVATRSVIALYRKVLTPLGLTHPQFLVMVAFWEHGPQSVKDLSTRLRLDPGTLSPLLKRLEARGLLIRRRNPRDERSLVISLTESGHALRHEAEKVPATVLAELGMDPKDVERLQAALEVVISGADRALQRD
jgi:DNA-binding MarR family transcriptional regulator